MEFDWTRCVICQQDKAEPLKCPMHGPASSCEKKNVYSTFLVNVREFRGLNALPTTIYFNESVSATDLENNPRLYE